MADFNPPLTVRNCGNPEHGPNWECHRVTDATGDIILRDVTRDIAEAYASIPSLREQVRTLMAEKERAEHERGELRAGLAEALNERDVLRAEAATLTAERDVARETIRNVASTLGCPISEVHYAAGATRDVADQAEAINLRQEHALDALRARVAELETERDTAISQFRYAAKALEAAADERDAAQQRAKALAEELAKVLGALAAAQSALPWGSEIRHSTGSAYDIGKAVLGANTEAP